MSDAGIRTTAVVSDAHGVAATAIIDCLLAGGTPEQALTHAGRLQAAPETLLALLQGEPSAEHRFVAQTIRHHIHYLDARLADLEGHLLEALQPHEAAMQLCQIAWAAVRTTSQFKGRFQSLVGRRGTKWAIIAIGHKVLKTVFVLLSRQMPYQDSTVDYD